jgi:chemotaxis family two-component system sensor kinase Cph1
MEMNITNETPLRTALEKLAPHDHLCAIYESPDEHFAVAVPFIRIGLDRGEKCVYIADDGTEAVVRDAMWAGGIDVERAIATGGLVLDKKEGAYLKSGSFDPEWMFTFWAEATAEAMSQGFAALRVTGETEWVLRGAPGLERWMEYESRLTHMLAHHNCFALCLYNGQLFPPDLVLDVIRTHPTVIYRGIVCRNMYHVPPDELLGTNQAAREVERLLTNIREREEIEIERARLDSITDAALAYLSLDDLLRELLARLRSALRAEYAAFRLIDEESQELVLRAVDGAPFGRVAGIPIPLESASPVRLDAPYVVDALRPPDPDRDDWYARLWSAIGLPLRAGMGVPLLVEGKPIGVVSVASTRTPFTEEDQRLLRVVADRVAPAIERGRLVETVGESRRRLAALSQRLVEVQEAERHEIARELHDEVGQLLTGLLFKIEGHGAGTGNRKDEMKGIVNDLIGRVRDLSMTLRPPMLDELGLLAALTWQIDRFEAQTGISVRFHHADLDRRFGAQVEITAFRIVQEALTNVARHAGVAHVSVDVWANPVSVGARIEDEGRGFDVEAPLAAPSSGLEGMRERSRLAGGRLAVESAPGEGTRLSLELPLAPPSLPKEDEG